jgi:hypothetical protein
MGINFKYIVLCFVMVVFNCQIVAQITPPVSNELDLQYTPKGSGPLSIESKSNSSGGSANRNDAKNFIKFSPTLISRNIAALYYERNFHENFSLQAGIGFNFNKDRIFSLLGSNMLFSESTNLQGEESMADVLSASTHQKIAPYLYIAPKFIFESYLFDGSSYIELAFINYANKLNYVVPPNNYSNGSAEIVGSNKLTFNFNIFSLKYGYQILTDTKLITSHEFFFTAGYRMITYNPVIRTDIYYNSSSNITQQYTVSSIKSSKPTFMFGVGYTFGIGW